MYKKSLKQHFVPDNKEASKTTEVLSERLRVQLEQFLSGRKWDNMNISEDNIYNGLRHNCMFKQMSSFDLKKWLVEDVNEPIIIFKS